MNKPTSPCPPEANAPAPDWSRQDALLRELHAEVLSEPLPPEWVALARGANRRHAQALRWRRLGGMAAGLLLAFGAGWMAKGNWPPPGARLAQHFAKDAALAHAAYTPEQRHPVEVAAAQEEHLVQWLSKRLGRPLRIPSLQAQGYALVGGRLLPGEDGARAQFMYQGAGGERLTLYVGARDARLAAQGETAFQYADDGGAARFYWVEDGAGYALVGALPRERLMALASEAYRQLGLR